MKSIKKTLAVVLTLVMAFSAVCWNASAASSDALDLVFIINTTDSMDEDIAQLKADMKDHLKHLDDSGMDYRIAVVDYRDFASVTGEPADYPYAVQCDFTNKSDTILSGVNGLTLGDGGDWEETMYSAIIEGLDELSWRSSSIKAAILITDSSAHDPEPFTGYTAEMAITKLKDGGASYGDETQARSKITLFGIATGDNVQTEKCLKKLSDATGGETYSPSASSDMKQIITQIIDTIPTNTQAPSDSIFDLILSFVMEFLNIIIELVMSLVGA